MYVCMSCMRVTSHGLCGCHEPDVKRVEMEFKCKTEREFCFECEQYVCPEDCACEK